MNDNDKSKKERLFCCYYAKLGNIFEAAVRAGFSPEKVSKKHICSYV